MRRNARYQAVPDNIHLEYWYPQPSVIPQVDLFIHHGGNNSLNEALTFGKPSLVMPYCWDGHDNAQRVEARKLGANTAGLREDAAKAIASVRAMSEQASGTLALVRDEAGAFVHTSRRIRRKLLRGVDRVEERLVDLDTLYGVVHDEIEEAALDVASTLRSVRSGHGAIGMLRRLLVPRR